MNSLALVAPHPSQLWVYFVACLVYKHQEKEKYISLWRCSGNHGRCETYGRGKISTIYSYELCVRGSLAISYIYVRTARKILERSDPVLPHYTISALMHVMWDRLSKPSAPIRVLDSVTVLRRSDSTGAGSADQSAASGHIIQQAGG